MAQQVEHVLGKDEVTGSNPVSSSIFVVRKSYNTQKAQVTHVSCAFLLLYLVFFLSDKIFEFNSCI